MAEETIGTWTPALLTKFIQDLFQNQPPSFLPHLRAEEITVDKKLTLRQILAVSREPNFRMIGGTGQPAFESGWVNFGSGWADAGFWKDAFGWVNLMGVIKDGSVGDEAFVLPPGYRPKYSQPFPAVSNNAAGQVQVFTDGTVVPTTPSSNVWVSLSGIRFRTT